VRNKFAVPHFDDLCHVIDSVAGQDRIAAIWTK
jgi:hypothetical protein